MKKILLISTVSRQFYLFEKSNIQLLRRLGFEIHCAADFSDWDSKYDFLNLIKHQVSIQRSPFSVKNVKAYHELKSLIIAGRFDAVHCHSPMGGFLGRLAAMSVDCGKILYTAHGFHFYKGCPLVNKIIYKNIETWLARYTDVIITINSEDYWAACQFRHKKGKVYYVPGIGVDVESIQKLEVDKAKLLSELGIPQNNAIILSIGELNKNKDNETVLQAFSLMKNENVVYIICGRGKLNNFLKQRCRDLGIEKRVFFLGFRKDIPRILKIADVFVLSSFREGLSVSMIEAMSSGLPCVASKIRGNIDLIDEGQQGFLVPPGEAEKFAEAIDKILDDSVLRERMSRESKEKAKHFDISEVSKTMLEIYQSNIS